MNAVYATYFPGAPPRDHIAARARRAYCARDPAVRSWQFTENIRARREFHACQATPASTEAAPASATHPSARHGSATTDRVRDPAPAAGSASFEDRHAFDSPCQQPIRQADLKAAEIRDDARSFHAGMAIGSAPGMIAAARSGCPGPPPAARCRARARQAAHAGQRQGPGEADANAIAFPAAGSGAVDCGRVREQNRSIPAATSRPHPGVQPRRLLSITAGRSGAGTAAPWPAGTPHWRRRELVGVTKSPAWRRMRAHHERPRIPPPARLGSNRHSTAPRRRSAMPHLRRVQARRFDRRAAGGNSSAVATSISAGRARRIPPLSSIATSSPKALRERRPAHCRSKSPATLPGILGPGVLPFEFPTGAL